MDLTSATQISALLGISLWTMVIVLVWSLVWKGIALWKSARKKQPAWFIILLIVNTLGILEILYIFLFSKIKLEPKTEEKPRTRKKRRK